MSSLNYPAAKLMYELYLSEKDDQEGLQSIAEELHFLFWRLRESGRVGSIYVDQEDVNAPLAIGKGKDWSLVLPGEPAACHCSGAGRSEAAVEHREESASPDIVSDYLPHQWASSSGSESPKVSSQPKRIAPSSPGSVLERFAALYSPLQKMNMGRKELIGLMNAADVTFRYQRAQFPDTDLGRRRLVGLNKQHRNMMRVASFFDLRVVLYKVIGCVTWPRIVPTLAEKRQRIIGWPQDCRLPSSLPINHWTVAERVSMYLAIWHGRLRVSAWDEEESEDKFPALIITDHTIPRRFNFKKRLMDTQSQSAANSTPDTSTSSSSELPATRKRKRVEPTVSGNDGHRKDIDVASAHKVPAGDRPKKQFQAFMTHVSVPPLDRRHKLMSEEL